MSKEEDERVDEAEIDDWLDSDSDQGEISCTTGTPGDSFVRDGEDGEDEDGDGDGDGRVGTFEATVGATGVGSRGEEEKASALAMTVHPSAAMPPEPKPTPEAEPKAEVEPKAEAEPKAEVEPKAEAEREVEPDPETGAPEPAPEPSVVAVPGPVDAASTQPAETAGSADASDMSSMQTLSLSPTSSPAAAPPPHGRARLGSEDSETRAVQTAPGTPLRAPPVVGDMSGASENVEEAEDVYYAGEDDAGAGLGLGGLGAWGLGGGGESSRGGAGAGGVWANSLTSRLSGVARAASQGLTAVAASDFASKAVTAARGMGKDLAELQSHITGEDRLPSPSRTEAREDEDVRGGGEEDALSGGGAAGGIWGAFSGLARGAARLAERAESAIESATATAASELEATAAEVGEDVAYVQARSQEYVPSAAAFESFASRSTRMVSGLASRLEAGAFELLRAHQAALHAGLGGADAAAAAESASLDAMLREYGCPDHVEELDRMADAAMMRCNRHRHGLSSKEAREAFDEVAREVQGMLDVDVDEEPNDDEVAAAAARARVGHEGDDEAGAAAADVAPAAAALATTAALRESAVRRCREMSRAVARTLESEAAALRGEAGGSPAASPPSPQDEKVTVREGRRRVSMLSRLRLLESAEGKVSAIRVEATQRLAELTTLVAAHLHALAASLAANDPGDGYEWSASAADSFARTDSGLTEPTDPHAAAVSSAATARARTVRRQVVSMLRDVNALVEGTAAALEQATSGADAALDDGDDGAVSTTQTGGGVDDEACEGTPHSGGPPAVATVGAAAREALRSDKETAMAYVAESAQSMVFIIVDAAVAAVGSASDAEVGEAATVAASVA